MADEGSLAGKLSSSASSTFHSSCFGSAGLGWGGRRVPLIFGAGGLGFLEGMREYYYPNTTIVCRPRAAGTPPGPH